KKEVEPWKPEVGMPTVFMGDRNLRKDHGEYYTLRQAAEVLGCSRGTVRDKVRSGILKGYHAATNNPNAKWNERRWYFVKKEDVHDLKGSREYRKRRAAYFLGRHRMAFGEDVEVE